MMNRLLKKLFNAQSRYENSVGDAEQALADKIDFVFSITYQESDDWLILSADLSAVAPLDSCMNVIKKKGVLTLEDFKPLRV